MRVLCCGDRNWRDAGVIRRRLEQLPPDTIVIEGEARGADKISRYVAESLGMKVERYAALWDEHGKAAGVIRNQEMLDTGIDLVLAFHNSIETSKGTGDMVRRARKKGVPVEVITDGPQ